MISGLVAAGGLAGGALHRRRPAARDRQRAVHDIYYKMLDPQAPTIRRLTVARVLLLFVAGRSGSNGGNEAGATFWPWSDWAFSLAMAGNFQALVMGVWWKRTTATGAVCGMIAGFGLRLFYLVTTRYFPGASVSTTSACRRCYNPADRQAGGRRSGGGHGAAERDGSWSTLAHPLCQQGGLVRPQQHRLRSAGNAAGLPGDLCGTA